MKDREATQEFTIHNVLVGHCGEVLTPDKIEAILKELTTEVGHLKKIN